MPSSSSRLSSSALSSSPSLRDRFSCRSSFLYRLLILISHRLSLRVLCPASSVSLTLLRTAFTTDITTKRRVRSRTHGCDCFLSNFRRKRLFRTSAHSGTATTSVYGDFEVYRILWDRYEYSSPTGTKATGPYPYPRSPWRGSRNAFVKFHLKSDPKRNNEPRAWKATLHMKPMTEL